MPTLLLLEMILILSVHMRKAEEEEATDADTLVNNAIAEHEESMLAGGGMDKEELGEGYVPPPVFKTMAFPFKQTSLLMLTDNVKAIKVQYTGTKMAIWDCISKSGSKYIIVNDNTCEGSSSSQRRLCHLLKA